MNSVGHKTITVGIAAGLLFAGTHFKWPYDIINGLVGGCLLNLFIHPDLDQANINTLKRPWVIPWWVYSKIIRKHRSFWSHFPIVGTAGRLLYIAIIIVAILFAVNHFFPLKISWEKWMTFAIVGLIIADAAHYVADIVRSATKF